MTAAERRIQLGTNHHILVMIAPLGNPDTVDMYTRQFSQLFTGKPPLLACLAEFPTACTQVTMRITIFHSESHLAMMLDLQISSFLKKHRILQIITMSKKLYEKLKLQGLPGRLPISIQSGHPRDMLQMDMHDRVGGPDAELVRVPVDDDPAHAAPDFQQDVADGRERPPCGNRSSGRQERVGEHCTKQEHHPN
jgi:hypothetical protein